MRKDIFFLVFLILFMSSVSAITTYKQSSELDLRHPVRVEGGIVGGINCNITVIDPNETILVNFKQMTDQSITKGYQNYTLNTTQTFLKGQYDYFITCTNNNINKTEDFSFLINLSGIEPSEERTQSLTRAIYLFILLGTIIFLTFIFAKFSLPVKWTLLALSIIFFLMGINTIFISLLDEVVSPNLENFFEGMVRISFIFYWGAAGFLIVLWIFTFINTWVYKNNISMIKRYGLE